jgi:hypothetical protein
MAGGPVQRLGARCAASRSAKAICGSSPRVSPTAVTSATSVTASSPCQRSQNGRGHHDDDPGWEWCCGDRAAVAPGLRSLRWAVRDGDAPLVGQQVLQAQVQRRLPSRNRAGSDDGPSLVRVAGPGLAKTIITGPEGKLCCVRVSWPGGLERAYLVHLFPWPAPLIARASAFIAASAPPFGGGRGQPHRERLG